MTASNDSKDDKRRVLLILANPFPLSVATLHQAGKDEVNAGAAVDAFDAYWDVVSYSPKSKARDRLYEKVARKYERFVLPVINGDDITGTIEKFDGAVPALPKTYDELRAASSHGAKVGLAALSTAATMTQITDRELTSRYGPTLDEAWVTAHRAAAAADQLRGKYDSVYIFNGRTAESRPFCDILSKDSEILRYDAGGPPDSYVVSSKPLYDGYHFARRVTAHATDVEAGTRFYESRRNRTPGTDAHKFTHRQQIGKLPDRKQSVPLISLFTSSEDEFFAIKDHASFGSFGSQFDVALAVAAICREFGKDFALRLHPHLALKNDSWRSYWPLDRLADLGARIIEPNDPVDSYALLDASQAVVTCGSTISLEAAYSEVPGLIIGENYATHLGVCHFADDSAGIADFLRDPQILPEGRDRAIAYASYKEIGGSPVDGLKDGSDPAKARLHGSTMDPVRMAIGRVKTWRRR